jgi:uncharacterized cupredoxin-like copper-binding protein
MNPNVALAILALASMPGLADTGKGAHEHAAVPAQTAYGVALEPRKAKRALSVDMSDTMRFTPAEVTLRRGETVRFVAANRGKLVHELVLGTMDELERHAKEMAQHPGMQHAELNMLQVAPGRTGELGWHFNRAGTFYYGCLVPGHFEAGMIGRITVVP